MSCAISTSIESSPVFVALERIFAIDWLVNAVPLWKAAGRPRNRSPRRFFPPAQIAYDDGGPPDGHVLVDSIDVIRYATSLDDRIEAWIAHKREQMSDGALLEELIARPTPLMVHLGMLAITELTDREFSEAGDELIWFVATLTKSMDMYEQETLIAKIQRAVRGEPRI
jgi:hypothetical protein